MPKMDDDDAPATRGDLKKLGAELRTEFKSELTREIGGVKSEITGVKSEIGGLKTEISGLKSEISGLRAEFKSDLVALESRLEATLTRTIQAAYEGFRHDFRVLDDQDKAISERSSWQIGNVLAELDAQRAELDAHRADPTAHERR
jgi:septal ring factor EnvC (AmiA/AmiB activator)